MTSANVYKRPCVSAIACDAGIFFMCLVHIFGKAGTLTGTQIFYFRMPPCVLCVRILVQGNAPFCDLKRFWHSTALQRCLRSCFSNFVHYVEKRLFL